MSFWDRAERIADDWNVLRHPFYERWNDGELLREELARYSGQYRHAVKALADASAKAAEGADEPVREQLEEHAEEEASHVELWDEFVDEVGGDAGADPVLETQICANAWIGEGRSTEESLAALYVIESAQPAIADVKRDGLLTHYGVEPGPGTRYFDLHAKLDHEHAAAHRELLEPLVGRGRDDAMLAAMREALAGNWALLDGIDRPRD
jgi:pyrroloquinoline-quinone synthase